jgi:hypothetical protein
MKTLIFLSHFIFFITAEASTYKMNWIIKNDLPIEIELKRAPQASKSRVGEHGLLTDQIFLPVRNVISDGKIKLTSDETGYLYIFIKNLSNKLIHFSVAPHGIEPSEAALGFTFNCLCKGHAYELKPKSTWYRIMSLVQTSSYKDPQKIIQLDHVIFKIGK